MKELTKPYNGISFWIWKFLFHFNFAKTLSWAEDFNNKRNTYFFGIHLVQKITEDNDILRAISLYFGPIKIMVGLAI